MKWNIFFFNVLLLLSCTSNAQTYQLKSLSHGFDLMLRNVPKEDLMKEMRFEGGADDHINAIRFDHVGPGPCPLIISSKLPLPTDSLGILSFKLQKDTLYNFLETIDNINPKMDNKQLDYVLIRVTYRFEDRIEQYYITNARIATGFLKIIEGKLIANKDEDAVNKFYLFISEMKLQKGVHGKRTWIY